MPVVQFTILAHLGLVDLDIFVTGKTQREAHGTVRTLVKRIRHKIGDSFYGMDADYPLEKVVGDRFRRARATLAVAESCTGGMLAAKLTDVPGSSDYFVGGVVSYANRAKAGVLRVSPKLLARHGAVSEPVARAMAQGVRQALGTTWGLAITGIAGPAGGTPKKPVGLVHLALAGPKSTHAHFYQFRGTRDAIRQRAVIAALDLLRRI
jgi:nicotinamide-nucleotide amidase